MEDEAAKLNEVVVVGYGSVKKKDATGSVDLISSKEFNKGAIVSVDQLLTGKAAGVRITNNGGSPDSAPNIRIRGGSSLSAENNPLIVIDGVPLGFDNAAGNSNPLALVNPNDIESFSILKDASATAIFGSRASNGVIIITTKKGSSGKPEYNFSSSVAIGLLGKKINAKSSSEFVDFIKSNATLNQYTNLLGVDDPADPINTPHDDPATSKIEGRIIYNTDWQDAIYRESVSVDNNFSAKANLFGKIPFRGSIGYIDNKGIVKTSDFNRLTTSLKLTPSLFNKHLKIDINAKGQMSKKNAIDENGVFGSALTADPTKPIYDNSPSNIFGGYYQGTRPDGAQTVLDGAQNPLAILEQRSRPEKVRKLLGNIEFDYKMHFLPELRAVLNLGIETSESNIEEVYGQKAIQTYRPAGGGVFNPGINYQENQTITNKLMDAYLVYSKDLTGIVKKFDIQGGYTYQDFKTDGNQKRYETDPATGLRRLVDNPTNPNFRYYNPLNLQSFFGRSNVDIANKYLFTFSFRADASSLFRTEGKQWGYFPAAAFAWKISSESFLKDSKIISDLKLRLGVGKTGQQDVTKIASVGFFPSIPLFSAGNSNSQYLPNTNSYSAEPFNPNLTWEKTTTYNVGLDFELLKSKAVSGSLDFYQNKTTDLLVLVPGLPGQALRNEFADNIGSTEGKGFELNLNVKPISSDNFNLDLNGNVAFNYTKVTNLKGKDAVPAPNTGLPIGTGVNSQYHVVGYQPNSVWVFQQLYDANGKVLENQYLDVDGDGFTTDADRVYKAVRPNWTYGFGANFNYKNIDFTASFRGQVGGLVYDTKELIAGNVKRAAPGANPTVLNNVLSGNIAFKDNIGNVPFSDYFLSDATFLRCENLTLGYTLNKAIKNASLKLYVAGNNLFLITKYRGQDPESFNGIDNNFYPRPKVYSFGINLNF
jgi:TonB-dependent starch-binding outer membrane protein SusC